MLLSHMQLGKTVMQPNHLYLMQQLLKVGNLREQLRSMPTSSLHLVGQ